MYNKYHPTFENLRNCLKNLSKNLRVLLDLVREKENKISTVEKYSWLDFTGVQP